MPVLCITILWGGYSYLHFTDEKNEAQREAGTCLRSLSWWAGELVPESRSIWVHVLPLYGKLLRPRTPTHITPVFLRSELFYHIFRINVMRAKNLLMGLGRGVCEEGAGRNIPLDTKIPDQYILWGQWACRRHYWVAKYVKSPSVAHAFW